MLCLAVAVFSIVYAASSASLAEEVVEGEEEDRQGALLYNGNFSREFVQIKMFRPQ